MNFVDTHFNNIRSNFFRNHLAQMDLIKSPIKSNEYYCKKKEEEEGTEGGNNFYKILATTESKKGTEKALE